MVNGSYTGSMLEVSNTLGTNTEDITMGYYATSAGFAIGYPIVPKVLSAIPEKMMLVVNLALQFLLSWVCARSQNVDILIVASFVIGFLKGFMMLWFIRMARFIFSPKDVRSEFYSYFFPLAFGFGQLSMVLTAELAYHYNWKYMYYFMMILMLISILTVIVCYIVIGPILLAFFIWLQKTAEKPFVSLAPLYQPKAVVGYFYMMLTEVAFPFFGGRSNGVFCRVLRHSLFHHFARKHV